jgi:hypothetical protein
MGTMANKPFFTRTTRSKPQRTGEAIDVAARYFIYEVYDATSGHAGAWKVLRHNGDLQATVARAVERGWAIVREDGKGRTKVWSASLTDEGRRMARKSLQ